MISDIKGILRAVFTLRFRELKNNRLFNMGIIGTIGFAIQATFFEIFGLQSAVFQPATAAVLGAELAIIVNFTLNNIFTFADRRISFSKSMVKKFLQFNFAVSISLLIQWVIVNIGEFVANGNFMMLRGFNALGVLVGFIFNYFIYTKVIWKQKMT